MDDGIANIEMAENWNGPGGRHWVADADRHDRALAAYGDAVLAAADVRDADRVLDIGGGTGALTRGSPARAGRFCARRGHRPPDGRGGARPDRSRRRTSERRLRAGRRPGPPVRRRSVRPGAEPVRGDVLRRPGRRFANVRRALGSDGRLAFASWRPVEVNEWIVVPLAGLVAVVGAPDLPGPHDPGRSRSTIRVRVRTLLLGAGFAGSSSTRSTTRCGSAPTSTTPRTTCAAERGPPHARRPSPTRSRRRWR